MTRHCQYPKRRPIAPTPVWKRDALSRIWLTPEDVAQLVLARQRVLQSLLHQRCLGDELHLARLSLCDIRSRFNRVTAQLPTHALDWVVQPFLVTADELWLLKAIIHDSEVICAHRMQPGREPGRLLVQEFTTLTLIRAKLYRPDPAERGPARPFTD